MNTSASATALRPGELVCELILDPEALDHPLGTMLLGTRSAAASQSLTQRVIPEHTRQRARKRVHVVGGHEQT